MSDIQQIAQSYIDAGFAVVAIRAGEKRAVGPWKTTTLTAADFNPGDSIALKCGEPSGHRVDIDCDCREAIEAAKLLLPHTGWIYGRPGKPDSHHGYICEGAKTAQYADVGKGGMLVELRSTGGYSVAPPSIHPTGEVYVFTAQGKLLKVDLAICEVMVRDVAITALLARHWPTSARHNAIGPLAAFLIRAGVDNTVRIIEYAATIAGDPEVADRVKFAQATVAKFAADPKAKLTGGPTLIDMIGKPVVERLRSWLDLSADIAAIEEMNAKHFWVRMGKDDVIGREDTANGEVVFQRPKSLHSEYANRKIQDGKNKKGEPIFKPLSQVWLESTSRREYREVVFAPPPLKCADNDYNLWRGFAIEPKAGDCSLFLNHLRDVICSGNDTHYNYLLQLLAATVQEPGRQGEVAVVLRGEPGTGKGTFVRALMDIFGQRHTIHLDNTKHLVGGFNAAISGKVIVFADEALWAGDKRSQGALKRLITEPTLAIERKGIDVVQERNCIHLFVATNEDWSIPAMLKERRYLALQVSSKYRNNRPYFNALQDEIDNGGIAAFLHQMLVHPFDRDVLRDPPVTDELRNQQEETMSYEMSWLHEALEVGSIAGSAWPKDADPERWVEGPKCYDAYKVTTNGRALNSIGFAKRIVPIIATKSEARRNGNNLVKMWKLKTLAEARKAFDAKRFSDGSTGDWPNLLPGYDTTRNPRVI